MHPEIYTLNQSELLNYIQDFKRSFYLVGGTAIALHLGHRRSVDFDMFTISKLNRPAIKDKLSKIPFKRILVFEDYDQLHVLINEVKLTFFSFPYPVTHPIKVGSILTMPSLLSLAAMKAYALGRRSKWKDYVDLYYILRNHYTIDEISLEAEKIFSQQFSVKLFRGQLAFHKDIDFSEPVEFMGAPIPEAVIKEFLIEKAIDFL
jgi:hypothetical protein